MRRASVFAPLLVVGVLALPTPALADDSYTWPAIEQLDLDVPGDSEIPRSVRHYDSLHSIRHYEVESSVHRLDTTSKVGDDTVLTLSADILFDVDKAELSPQATARIAKLVAAIPETAKVAVGGHTDSTGTPQHNRDLSDRRARAVAAAIRAARPDLRLSVEGFGETRPAVPEQGDDLLDDRRKNRRVEVRWG